MVIRSNVCTYKRCKICELIREASESNESMFMVTKKTVSQLGNACDMILRNDSKMNIFDFLGIILNCVKVASIAVKIFFMIVGACLPHKSKILIQPASIILSD